MSEKSEFSPFFPEMRYDRFEIEYMRFQPSHFIFRFFTFNCPLTKLQQGLQYPSLLS